MEVESNMGPTAPSYTPTVEYNNQSKHAPKSYNLAITSISTDLTTDQFISLQRELLTMITTKHPTAVFKVVSVQDPTDKMEEGMLLDDSFQPPVKEIRFHDKRKNLISALPIKTSLSPHKMKDNARI